MLTKFTIEYAPFHRSSEHAPTREHAQAHRTDDPIEAEEFLMQLLVTGARILSIKHEGVEIPRSQFDRMLKVASERLASELLRRALSIDAAEVKHRFGLAA